MANGYCTECRGNINLGNKPRKGQIVYCHKCGARMKVDNLSPIELEWIFEEDLGDWPKFDLDFDFGFIKYQV